MFALRASRLWLISSKSLGRITRIHVLIQWLLALKYVSLIFLINSFIWLLLYSLSQIDISYLSNYYMWYIHCTNSCNEILNVKILLIILVVKYFIAANLRATWNEQQLYFSSNENTNYINHITSPKSIYS